LLAPLSTQAQNSTAGEIMPGHHGSFSCRLNGETPDGSRYRVTVSYEENGRGLIKKAGLYERVVPWYLEFSWSWHAWAVNISIAQPLYNYRHSAVCHASARS